MVSLITGAKTEYTYDSRGRLSAVEVKDSSNTLVGKETYTYDEAHGTDKLYLTTKTVWGEAGAPDIVTTEYADKYGNVVMRGRRNGSSAYRKRGRGAQGDLRV